MNNLSRKFSVPSLSFISVVLLLTYVSQAQTGYLVSPQFFGGHVDYANEPGVHSNINSLSPPPLVVPLGTGFVNIPQRPLHNPLGTMRLWVPGMFWDNICPNRPQQPNLSDCDWTTFNNFIGYLTKHPNIDTIFSFGHIPCWANADPNKLCVNNVTTNITNISDWHNFVTQVVARANGTIKYFEIFNEPNEPTGWTGSISTLVQMAQIVWNAVKPNGKFVLSPAPSKPDSNWESSYLNAGGGQYADVIAVHTYVGDQLTAEAVISPIKSFQQTLTQHGLSSKPLWDTETNCEHFTAPFQCAEWHTSCMARKYSLEAGLGIGRMVWFTWAGQLGTQTSPGTCGNEPRDILYGGSLWNVLTDSIWEPGIGYLNLEQWMTGATIQACVNSPVTSVWTCNLTRANGYSAQIIWSTGSSQPYTVSASFHDYRDLIQNYPVPIQSNAVQIGQRPILVESSQVF
jgi:hypothetical protein